MLKLSDLFEDFDLAYKGLSLYSFDKNKTKDVINYFRISSNAVYPFVNENGLNFLRIASTKERNLKETISELEVLNYIKDKKMNVMEIVPMLDKQLFKVINHQNKDYIVVAFKKVKGVSLEDYIKDNGADEKLIFEYGKTLGLLHKNLAGLNKVNRKTHIEFLNEIESNLLNYSGNEKIILNFKKIKELVLELPINVTNYGLIHYDFELDNAFYDENIGLSIIDFDDSHYNFFNMDIVRCLNELNNIDGNYKDSFLEGYKSEMLIDEKIPFDLMDKLANFQFYSEICRTLSDEVLNKPDWMEEIIEKLTLDRNNLEKRLLNL